MIGNIDPWASDWPELPRLDLSLPDWTPELLPPPVPPGAVAPPGGRKRAARRCSTRARVRHG